MSKTTKKEPMSKKAKTYWAIGIVCAIAVIALLVYNSGIGTKTATAATVGDQEFTVPEVSYYYSSISSNFIQQAQQYAAYGLDMGYDSTKSPSEQFYNEEDGVTYADYFLESAMNEVQRIAILCSEAKAAGYTLSEEGQAAFQENMDYLKMYSIQNSMNEDSYLKAAYGRHMTKGLFEKILTNSILADEYAHVKTEEFTVDQAELDTYYTENADALDSYEYRYCTINCEVEDKVDDAGNAVQPTEEETAAAMEVASNEANAMIAEVRAGTAFNEAAAKYVNEASAASYTEDADYNHKVDQLGADVTSFLPAEAGAWLIDAGRTPGQMTAIKQDGVGYYVVQFLGRDKGVDSYQTATYRNLLVLAETGEGEDGVAAAPTEEQLAAAKTQAESLLAQWNEGAANADTFAELVAGNSADEATKDNGGLNEEVNRDTLAAPMTEYIFDRARESGDAAVVEYTDATGAVVGYQVIFVESFGQIRWEYQATTAIQAEAYNAWYTEVQANYPAELTEDGKKIPNL